MLQAASMSGWWFILFCIPVLNLVGYVVWSFKIVHARGKTLPLAILLLLPVTNVFAFLYLAFSEAPAGKMQGERLEILGLQTA
jgi:apolipoprotein N-acyltransferase